MKRGRCEAALFYKWLKNVKFDFLKVTGRYSVLLPDGRLMTVEYTADLQNGFVPKIFFANKANPITGWLEKTKRKSHREIFQLSHKNWFSNLSTNTSTKDWKNLKQLWVPWHKMVPIIIISIKISLYINWIINFYIPHSFLLILMLDHKNILKYICPHQCPHLKYALLNRAVNIESLESKFQSLLLSFFQ